MKLIGFNMKFGLSALAFLVASLPSSAATIVNFNWTGTGGYTVNGSFQYDPAATPVSFSEVPGAGPTQFIQAFHVSFFSPQLVLLETGSSIIDAVSSDRFFRLDYNTQTHVISSLDADVGGSNYQYFLTNLRTPDGQVVAPGVTTFNLFVRTAGTPNLDIAPSVQVTSIAQTPEPASFALAAVSGIAGLAAYLIRRRNIRAL